MSNDDLIRRGDARRILEEEGFLERSLANLNDLPAMQVAVKPLEWLEIREGQYFEARVIGILYSVRLGSDGVVRWQAGHMGTWHEAPTIESAKAAAQADYEGRIRSALTAQPSPDVAALVEAAAKIGQIVGFLGEDAARIAAFREACGSELWDQARAALARVKGGVE